MFRPRCCVLCVAVAKQLQGMKVAEVEEPAQPVDEAGIMKAFDLLNADDPRWVGHSGQAVQRSSLDSGVHAHRRQGYMQHRGPQLSAVLLPRMINTSQ